MADDIQLEISLETDAALKQVGKFQKQLTSELGAVEKGLSGLKSFGAGVAGAIAAGFAAFKLADFLKEGIDAAAEAEAAVGKLTQQLKLSGDFSEEALTSFTNLAGELERTTNISEELILEQAGIAKAFGLTNDQAEKLVGAAVELSAVTGDDLSTSVQQLIKSYNGQSKALEATVGEVRTLTKEQLAAGAAIDLIADKFGGTAAAKLNTFSGAIQSAERAFGDIQKELGKGVISNGKLVAAIRLITEAFDEVVDFLGQNKSAVDSFVNLLIDGMFLAGEAVTGLGSVIERVLGFALLGVTGLLEGVLLGLEKLARFGGTATEGIAQGLEDARTQLSAFNKATGKSVTEGSGAFGQLNDKISSIRSSLKDVSTEAVIATETINKAAKESKPFIDADELERLKGEYKRFSNEISNIAADEAGRVLLRQQEQLTQLDEFNRKRVISEQEYQEQKILIDKSTRKQLDEISAKQAETELNRQKQLQSDIKSAAADAFANPIEYVLKQTGALDVNAKNAAPDLTNAIAAGAGVLTTVLQGEEGAKKFAATAGAGIANAFLPGLGAAIGPLITALTEDKETIRENTREFIAALDDVVVGILEGLFVLIEELVKGLARAFLLLSKNILTGIQQIVPKIFAFIGGFVQAIRNVFAGIIQSFSNIFTNIISSFSNVFSNLVGQISGVLTSFVGSVSSIFTGLGNVLANIGMTIYEGILNGLQAIIDTTISSVTSIFEGVKNFGQSFIDSVKNLGSEFASTITDAFNSIGDFLSDQLQPIADLFSSIFTPIVDALNSIIDGIKGVTSGGGIGDKLSGAGEKILDFVGFADGGVVPAGFPNDSFPASLTSGELVVPTDLVSRLSRFLANPSAPAANSDVTNTLLAQIIQKLDNPMTVSTTAEVNGRALADIILQLNRNSARLTA